MKIKKVLRGRVEEEEEEERGKREHPFQAKASWRPHRGIMPSCGGVARVQDGHHALGSLEAAVQAKEAANWK